MDFMIIVMLIMVVGIGVLMLFIMATTHKASGVLDLEEYRTAWLKIENSLDGNNIASYHLGILNADKLLDKALKELGVQGITMGERLKAAPHKFSNVQDVWFAHKLRNNIAHETNYDLKITEARKAIAIFRRSLKELRAL